jgi:hypothetical protein
MSKNNISDWIKLLSQSPSDAEIELPVLSGSMHPFLPCGAVAVIRKTSARDVKNLYAGSIVIFRKNFKFTAHRILIKPPLLPFVYEKGDRNRFGSFIHYSAISGVVCAVKGKKRITRNFLTPEEIRIAKREARKNIVRIAVHAFLLLSRRVAGVLEKK